MPMNLTDTYTMLAAIEEIRPHHNFLRDRYFPTGPADIFASEKVLVEYKDDNGRKLAPAVTGHAGGIPVGRAGYEIAEYEPPTIAPERELTIDHLTKKQFGEAIFSNMTPQQREAAILATDMVELSGMIDKTEEHMAAQVLTTNSVTLKQYADRYGEDYIEYNIKYYEGSNQAVYSPIADWTANVLTIDSDIVAMATMLKKRGLPATDLILGSTAASVFQSNTEIQNLLDNRRIIIADEVRPEIRPDGATLIGVFNFGGHLINVFAYDEEYTDEDGSSVPYIPAKGAIMTFPGMGRTAYGAVTQLEESVQNFVTYAGARVPQVVTDYRNNVRSMTMRAKPLTMPTYKNSAIYSQVIS